MIVSLKGILMESHPTLAVVDVHGVGYEVLMPLSSTTQLPAIGQEVKIQTHLVVREDAQTLYGFMSTAEKELFRILINSVSGIGPKIALNILSGMTVERFRLAVSSGDVKALSQVSGIGKKTAERIVVELKDKVGLTFSGTLPSAGASGAYSLSPLDKSLADAVSALMTLGFKQAEALTAAKAAQAMLGAEASVEELIRASLKK
ncbi:MAG: Holliday junction branch migration protein RuvA [Verrucomicrobia bacterium]|nr:Holliday junction branch migration protein RuvA [Verrucomicrobiota bacterium]